MTAINNENNNNNGNEKTKAGSSAVRVFVSIRPLIAEEKDHAEMKYKIIILHNRKNNSTQSLHLQMPSKKQPEINPSFQKHGSPPFLRRRRQEHSDCKVFDGFTAVLEPDATNAHVFRQAIQPALLQHDFHQSLCVFTYGHTGSSKSHTLLGYGDSLGIYKYAVQELFDNAIEQERCVLVRCMELYNQKVRDLLTEDECTIREDHRRVVQIRGPFAEDAEGRVEQTMLGQVSLGATSDGCCGPSLRGSSGRHIDAS